MIPLLAIVLNSAVLGADVYRWVHLGIPPDWLTALALFWVLSGMAAYHNDKG
ncbi:MAG: hypothetical protein LC131_07535 [Anaerolineae bacterium]|nr:hypothetical protein [Anaerolineae bacterium]